MGFLTALLAVFAFTPPSGTLYLAGVKPGQVTKVEVAAARVTTRHLREVSPGDPPYMVHATGGRVVAFGSDGPYVFGPALREPGRRLGRYSYFVPSATPGRVWLIGRRVREVTVAGRTIVSGHLPARASSIAGVDGGLLVQRRTLEVWDPVSDATVRRLPGVFPAAVRGSLVASCAERCPVLYLNDAAVRPHGFRFVESYDGAFSPDGALVAVPASGRRVALVDVATRSARLIPGARLAADYPLFAWSSTGWLFYNAGAGRIGAWRPGAARAMTLPLRVPPSTDMTAF